MAKRKIQGELMPPNPVQERILALVGNSPKPAAVGDEPAIAQILRKRAAQPRPTKLGEGVRQGMLVNETVLCIVYEAAVARGRGWGTEKQNERQLSQAISLARRAGWSQTQIDAAVAAGQPEGADEAVPEGGPQ